MALRRYLGESLIALTLKCAFRNCEEINVGSSLVRSAEFHATARIAVFAGRAVFYSFFLIFFCSLYIVLKRNVEARPVLTPRADSSAIFPYARAAETAVFLRCTGCTDSEVICLASSHSGAVRPTMNCAVNRLSLFDMVPDCELSTRSAVVTFPDLRKGELYPRRSLPLPDSKSQRRYVTRSHS